VLFLVLCGTVATPAVVAQDRVAVAAYADYFRLSQTDTNFAGVGGRLGVGLAHRVMLEAEMSYDFNQVFTENFDNGTPCSTPLRLHSRRLSATCRISAIRTSWVQSTPCGGLEGRIGPVGLRLDVGDEIYFNGGTHHNFRASFGPYIRF
jgi:hypothetical protein